MSAWHAFRKKKYYHCVFLAHRCPSYQHFLAGRCFKCNNGNCAIMGYHATLPKFQSANSSENEIFPSETATETVTPVPGKYFLATGKDFPFCREFPGIKFCIPICQQ